MTSNTLKQRESLENFLYEPSLDAIRQNYIQYHYSLPSDTPTEILRKKQKKVGTSLRGRIWKACIFKYFVPFDVDFYCDILEKNRIYSEEYTSIFGDVKRSYQLFEERVESAETRRLLQAFILKEGKGWYSQALPYPAAMFLWQMSEIEAFYLFLHWMTEHVPMLYRLEGSHGIFAVLETSRLLLQHFDPELESHLSENKINWKVFGFPWISSFFAQENDLGEVIKIWDFFALFGFHFISLVTAVLLISNRESILNIKNQSMSVLLKHLMTIKLLNTEQIISLSLSLIPKIPDHLYSTMLYVLTKPEVASTVLNKELKLRDI